MSRWAQWTTKDKPDRTEGDVKEFSACYHVLSLAKFGFTTFQMVYTSNLSHTHTAHFKRTWTNMTDGIRHHSWSPQSEIPHRKVWLQTHTFEETHNSVSDEEQCTTHNEGWGDECPLFQDFQLGWEGPAEEAVSSPPPPTGQLQIIRLLFCC